MNAINPNNPSYLMIFPKGQAPSTFNLDEGNSVFIGSGSNCGIQLSGDNIFQIHCMVWNKDNTVAVQDWNTNATFVNGRQIDSELTLKSGDQIVIGNCQLIPVLDRQFHLGIATELMNNPPDFPNVDTSLELARSTTSAPTTLASTALTTEPNERYEEPAAEESLAGSMSFDETSLSDTREADGFGEADPFHSDLEQLVESTTSFLESQSDTRKSSPNGQSDSRSSCGEFVYDIDADLNGDDDEEFDGSLYADAFVDEESDENDEELLKVEVEQLRFELAEKDAKIRSLMDQRNGHAETIVDDEQTIKLVNRLEELLDELQTSDDRIKGLEELLRVSDQATQAEKEERQQLESWVTEIENRVADRQSESDAEIERLTRQLEEARTHAKQAEKRFRKLAQAQQASPNHAVTLDQASELIQECRQQIDLLRKELAQCRAENEQLRSQPSADPVLLNVRDENQQLKEKMAKLEVEGAREKAELARKHAEIERLRGDLEEKLASAKKFNKGDSRIQAMRQHLRDIHEEEKLEKEERWRQSLGGRIVRLLGGSN